MKKNWIKAPVDTQSAVVDFAKNFQIKAGKIKKAFLNVTSMGVYVPYINGQRVGENVLAPGWTSYQNRVLYQTYNVEELLQEKNEIRVSVGPGWACGDGIAWQRFPYSDHVVLNAEIEIEYVSGKKQIIYTDESWQTFTNEVTYAEIYHGETVDKTAPIRSLGKAVKDKQVKGKCVKQNGEWIVENERLAPIEYIITPKGEKVIDFGQNMTGYVQVKIKAPRGARIVMHHAEVLDKDGNFYTENYRTARNENTFICSGENDVFKPKFTFQGFRYIRLNEYPFESVDLENFTAIVVHSQMQRTGRYNCGNEKINQLYHNVVWGQKSNYLDIPTDCPQRNERLGWTGDTQVFCRTGAINYNVKKFFEKWLDDVALEQKPNGRVPTVVPVPCELGVSAAWGDVACIVPWEIYKAYGDKKLLKRNFPMMKKWVGYMHETGSEEFLWLGTDRYGDWLAMDAGADSYQGATSRDLIASAFFAYSTSLVVKAGEVLGENVEEYKILHGNIVKKFREYFIENGQFIYEKAFREEIYADAGSEKTLKQGVTQTALVLTLHFDLCTAEDRPVFAKKLVEIIQNNGGKMTTGFVGTPYLLHALSENGYANVAYDLLLQEENPSWLYSVNRGATTMWEHWNSLKEDGSFWSADMNSFNHYAYGAVFDWIFGVSSGIQPKEAGYKEISIAPVPDKRLGFADASIQTAFGLVRSHWYYKGETVYYEFEIPQGVKAKVKLPSGKEQTLESGNYMFAE